MIKIKGGYAPKISYDGTMIATFSSGKIVYVYTIPEFTCILKTKTINHVSDVAFSHDGKLLAIKNTSGTLAVVDIETGEILGKNSMEKQEGYETIFTQNDKYILDFDWDGRIMLLDTKNFTHKVIWESSTHKPYIYYDSYPDKICAIMENAKPDKPCDRGMVMMAEPDFEKELQFCTVQEFEKALPPRFDWKISFGKKINIYLSEGKMIVTDKMFQEIQRIPIPEEFKRIITLLRISESGKYLFLNGDKKAALFELTTMKMLQEFEEEYISEVIFLEDERKIVLGTWSGTYIKDIQTSLNGKEQ